MPDNESPVKRRILGRTLVAAFALALTITAIACSGPSSSYNDSPPPGPTTPVAKAGIGEPAPGFTLADPQGKSVTVTPGDGKAYLLVFYMGYF